MPLDGRFFKVLDAEQLAPRVCGIAADIMETAGWWNGKDPRIGRGRMSVCAMIAIAEASEAAASMRPGTTFRTKLARYAEERLGDVIGEHRSRIAQWNDRQPSGDVVIAALRKAASNAM